MPTAELIDELMLRWEAARQEGNNLTPEELCLTCPSVLDEVRQRVEAIREMEQILGIQTALGAEHFNSKGPKEVLPIIPGYEILRVVDQGGMGVVYEARQAGLGRRVAVKMISHARLAPAALVRFRAEAEAAACLQHGNFVQVFEVGQVNERPFFSMEFVEGGTLAQTLDGKPLPPRQAAALAETLARAIQAAHECGIVHRDLKPANIMLTADGIPKIADFGLVKRIDEEGGHTQTGEILGTPSYMAPEQAEGRKDQIGPATDVYALGAILYEMLTAQPPFKGANALESLRQVTSQEPTPPSRFVPSVPRDLEAICLKCLEKAPSQRYPAARDLAEDLRRFQDGRPVTARPAGPLRRCWKWARRGQGRALAVAALLLLILVAGWTLLVPDSAQEQLRLQAERKELLAGEQAERQALLAREQAEHQAPRAREILRRNCYPCHGKDPANVRKDLNVLDHQLLLDSKRRLIVPGAPGDSRLMQRIADGSMPPEEDEATLPRLSHDELEILKEWVVGGAPPFPAEELEHPVIPYSPLAAEAKKVFLENCYECHKYDVARGGIKILHHRLLLSVRPVVIPHRPEASELFDLLTTSDDKRRMPPPPASPLTTQEIDVIRRWIQDGAAPFPRSD